MQKKTFRPGLRGGKRCTPTLLVRAGAGGLGIPSLLVSGQDPRSIPSTATGSHIPAGVADLTFSTHNPRILHSSGAGCRSAHGRLLSVHMCGGTFAGGGYR